MSDLIGLLPSAETVRRIDEILTILASGRVSYARDELKALREEIILGSPPFKGAA